MRGKRDHIRQRSLRHAQTEAERLLWRHIRDRRLLGFKFRRQHKIGNYFADFVCTDAKLIVELDGSQHLDQTAYDVKRTAWLQQQGHFVLRFWNDDVLLRTNKVLQAIAMALPAPHPAFGHPLPASGEREEQTC